MLLPILLTLAFIAASVPLVAAPLRRKAAHPTIEPVSDTTGGATSSYEATLLALRDLEFDRQLGVVNDDDYGQVHEQLVAEVAMALDSPPQADRLAAAAAIEAAVRARREQRPAPATRFCPQCGNPVDAGHRFCTGCGHALTQPGKEQLR